MTFAVMRQSGEWQARCDSWLRQVLDTERETAELLLDGIQYISQEDLMHGLRQELGKLLGHLQGPAGLYPVTNTRPFKPFESYAQLPFGVNGDLGGEGDLGHLCRDVCEGRPTNSSRAFPGLEYMRRQHVRHVVLVTDTASSGRQVTDYLGWMWHSRTIRSWWSAGLIRFHVIAFLLSDPARQLILRHPSQPQLFGIQAARSGHTHWRPAQRIAISELCTKYGPGKFELGFGGQFALDVFSYSCPNNVPGILRFDHRKTGFQGLFQRRPTDVSASVIAGPEANLEALSAWLGIRAASVGDAIAFALMAKPATPEQLSARLGLPLVMVNEGLARAHAAEHVRLLRHAYRLTDQGMRVARSVAGPLTHASRPNPPSGGRYGYLPQKRSPASPSSTAPSQEGAPDG